ncbi:hypothetical protein COJ92_27580 [Priestia megaterium]|uniref:hypothetical protein n=1 Tax=Priestia megaterium TaxID=1404 RepID=UPI000BF626C1|nr:hypothetical protein [Priestia megaterium]PFP10133.1 hypothetical protein COJ92_27580 [Priestia megaterium]PFU62391.1 hypothetical protein COK90_10785 [Priestia megaterium]
MPNKLEKRTYDTEFHKYFMSNKKEKSSSPLTKWDIFFTILFPVSLVIGWGVTIYVWFVEMNK